MFPVRRTDSCLELVFGSYQKNGRPLASRDLERIWIIAEAVECVREWADSRRANVQQVKPLSEWAEFELTAGIGLGVAEQSVTIVKVLNLGSLYWTVFAVHQTAAEFPG